MSRREAPLSDESTDCQAAAALLFGEALPLVEVYVDLLANEGIDWGLLGPREVERLWDRHILNSLAVNQWIDQGMYVADIGSGAGLPGIPLALTRPDLRVDLVEPMQRRVDFLQMCVERLDLGERVLVVRSRGEDYSKAVDVVTCRAVSPVKSLVGMMSHLVPPAQLLPIKGERADGEVQAARGELSKRGLNAEVMDSSVDGYRLGCVVRIRAR